MKTKKHPLYNLIGIVIILIHILPLYITLVTSLKLKSDLSSKWLLPSYFNLENFKNALTDSNFFLALWNSVIITFLALLITIVVGSMTAYVIARYKSWVTTFMFLVTMGVMMIPPISLIVPLYRVLLTLDGVNTYWGIITALSVQYLPISIIIYTAFIRAIPIDLDESAALDGCGNIRTFFSIILPQLWPVTASIIILNGVKIFNEFIYPLYFMQTPDKQMITTYISSFFNETSDLNLASSAAILAVIPIIVVYLLLQRFFIESGMEGMGR